jgi:phage terminase large subunit-like protein
MLQFGLRLGDRPRQVVTTTPRPVPLIKRLLVDPHVAVSRAATRGQPLQPGAGIFATVQEAYGGTRLGRQELDGEIVEESADALWTRAMIEDCRVTARPRWLASSWRSTRRPHPRSGPTPADWWWPASTAMASAMCWRMRPCRARGPHEWATRAVALYQRHEADALVVEVNQGGEMATSVIREVDPAVPVTAVRATRGKYLRAEPVAALYAQGRVRHAGPFRRSRTSFAILAPAA